MKNEAASGYNYHPLQLDAQLNTDAAIDSSVFASGIYYIVVNAGKDNAQVMKIVTN